MYTIEELVAKAKEWEKEICKGCICYRPSYAALIFPPLGQKVLFMSESPYNYPGQDVETLEDFITMDLQRKLARATHPRRWPRDIFEFIYHTFKPLFSETPREAWTETFLRNVYWTHAAKKTLKCLEERDKRKAVTLCLNTSFRRELNVIKPELAVIASSGALKGLFRISYREALATQLESIKKDKGLPTVEDLLRGKEQTIPELKRLAKCKVAVFPNPSPVAGKWKKEYYTAKRKETEKVLKEVHSILRSLTTT